MTDTSPEPPVSADAVQIDYAPTASTEPFATATSEGTTVNGQFYSHDDWSLTVTLTPKVFEPGYFRWADKPIDQHTGKAIYFTVEPPLAIYGTWVRCQVIDL